MRVDTVSVSPLITATPSFAVLLAAYNCVSFIEEQLCSILNQVNAKCVIYISIDQSSDGSESFIQQITKHDPRVIILPQVRRIGGAAANFYRLVNDVEFSEYDYVCFSDQDDVWEPDKLWRAHTLLTSTSASGYSSNVTAFWSSGRQRLVSKSTKQVKWDYLFESAGPGCSYVVTIELAIQFQVAVRNDVNSLLRIDYHDWLIYAFSRFNGYAWIIDNWSSLNYRQHNLNQIGANSGVRAFFLRVFKVIKGYGFVQASYIAYFVKAQNLPIYSKGLSNGRIGYLWMALNAKHCRRKSIDRFLFFVACLFGFVLNPRIVLEAKSID